MPDWLSLILYFLFTATFAVIRDTATVIGEEIGWRGFLVPELAKNRGFAATAVITGIIWAFWHSCRALRGLQERYSSLVLSVGADSNDASYHVRLDLVAAQVRQHLAVRDPSRFAQHIHSVLLRSLNRSQQEHKLRCK